MKTEDCIRTAIAAITEAILADAASDAYESATPTTNPDKTDASLDMWRKRIAELRAVREQLEETLRRGKLRGYDPR